MENNGTFTYYAFISHSHRDAKWATWIQEELERYRLPSAVRKAVRKPLPKRLAPVFRDATDLGTGQLVEGLHRELENSRFLIVICSPDSARPNAEGKHYVNHEIEYFAGLGRGDRVIPVIVRGTPEEAFCPKIRELDLLAIDATKTSRPRVLNDIVAKILSLRPDELWQRERRRQMMRRIEVSVLGAVAGLIVSVAGLFAWDATRRVENYYADYVDSYGLPEGVFPLEKNKLKGRHVHYRFEYEGIRYGKSVHADSSDWSFIRIFGFRRVLRRVVQADSRGGVREMNSTEHAERSPILEFEYKGKEGVLCQVICRTLGGRFLRRLILHDFKGVVNGAVELKGEEALMDIMDVAETTAESSIENERTIRSKIAKYILKRDSQGRQVERRFRDSTGNKSVADVDGIYGFTNTLDKIGRETEVWYLDVNGERRENRKGVAGKKYKYLDCNIVQSEYVNALGAPTLGPWGYVISASDYDSRGNSTHERFYDAASNKVMCASGFAEGRLQYDDYGNITSMSFYGLDGKRCLCDGGYAECRYEYDANGNVTFCCHFDTEGKLTLFKGCRYAGMIFKHDARGLETSQVWIGKDGLPTPIEGDIFGYRYEYDKCGNKTAVKFVGKNGELVLCKNGFAGWRAEYDDRGLMRVKTWIGVDGQPTFTKGGYAKCGYERDENGNVLKICFYGVDDSPVADKSGVFQTHYQYDEYGNKKEVWYLGVDRQLVHNEDGIAKYRYSYDSHGNKTSCRYFGADDSPCLCKYGNAGWIAGYDAKGNEVSNVWIDVYGQAMRLAAGWAECRYEYDALGNKTACRYYGADGKRCFHKDGNAGWIAEYDARGLEVRRLWLGLDDQPILIKDGWAESRYEYDTQGNKTACRYYGVDGKACRHKDGNAGWIAEYNVRGLQVRMLWIGLDGHPALINDGWAECRCEYDVHDNKTACLYYDEKANLCLQGNGSVGWRAEYDERRNEICRIFLGLGGQPTLVKAGFAERRREYDGSDNLVAERFYGVDGNPAMAFGQFSEVRNVYNAMGALVQRKYYDVKGRPVELKGLRSN